MGEIMENKIIARCIDETTTSRVEFISKQLPAKGEYVFLEYNNQTILGMIDFLYRGSLSLSDDIRNPELVSKIEALEGDVDHYIRGYITILGDIDTLEIPKIPAPPGIAVKKADSETLKKVFERENSIKIGSVLTQNDVPVKIDVNKMVSRHLAILAMTGAGKSNTTAVIIDQLLEINGTILVFDMHSEYGNIKFTNGKTNKIKPKINPQDLNIEEFKKLIHINETAVNQEEYLRFAYDYAKDEIKKGDNGKNIDFINTMRYKLKQIAEKLEDEKRKSHYDAAKQVEFKLDSMQRKYHTLFESNDQADIVDMINPGEVNIIGLGHVSERPVDILVKHVLSNILTRRKTKKLKFPVFCIIEEAHMIVSEKRNTQSKYIISKIAREGRKFGVGLCLVSQSPKSLDSETLSQVNNLIILKLVEPGDQTHVQKSSENLSSDMLKQLPSLNVGEAIVLGQMTNIPTMVKIDEFKGKNEGQDIDVIKEWQKVMEEKKAKFNSDMDDLDGMGI